MINVVRGFAYPDRDAAGRVQGAFVMLLDITRERAFEAAVAGRARRGDRGQPLQIALPRRGEPRPAPTAARHDAVRQFAEPPARRHGERRD